MPLGTGSFVYGPMGEIQPVYYEDIGSMRATWVDPTGVEWKLTSIDPTLGWFTTQKVGGWGARPYTFTTDPNPRGGDIVRSVRAEPARITWPLHIFSDHSHMEFVQRYRAIREAFMMTVHRGLPGTLRVARPDGSKREIDCWYEEGFKGEPGENWLSANPVLTLYAPDGYWRDPVPLSVYRQFDAGGDFLSPFPNVSSSQVLGSTTIVNPGDVSAWPVWTITGPCGTVTAVNNTTGQTFTVTYTLLAGEQLTITTLQPTVRGPAGQNIISALNFPTAYLWPLLPGSNSVNFTVTGAGGNTKIQLDFNPRYEGA